MPKRLLPLLCCCLILLLCEAAPLFAQPSDANSTHRRAVELARQGDFPQAVTDLRALHLDHPEDSDILHDLFVVLSWAGRSKEALELAEAIDPKTAPAFVLEELAASYRHEGRFEEAGQTYRLALQRFPKRVELHAGLAMTLADAGRPQEAIQLLGEPVPWKTGPLPLLFARGYALERRGARFDALRLYERIVHRAPGHRDARWRLALVLTDLGAPFLAEETAEEGNLLDEGQRQRLRADQAALLVRWQRLTPRYRAAARLEALLESDSSVIRQRSLADLVVLHSERGDMTAAIERYRQLERRTSETPLYARRAAAEALAAVGCPEEAERLYRQVLDERPDDFSARIGLFYALADQSDFDRALPWIDEVVADEPARLTDGAPNPRHLRARIAAGLGRLFADDEPEAERRFASLVRRAPGNADLWRELGSAESARGWPRRSQQTYRRGLALEPHHTGLHVGLADTHLDLGEFPEAKTALQRLCLSEPRHAGVRRLARRWQLHEMRELYVKASGGRSSGAEFGSREINLAATLLSQPIRHHFRTFVGYSRAEADFPEGEEVLHRYRAGLRYRDRDIVAEAEGNFNADGGREAGLALSSTWEPTDQWAFSARFELFSADTPLRAIKNGVHADGASLGVRWQPHERRRWRLSLQRLDFTDGNKRHSAYTFFGQRLFTRPGLFLDGELEAYASANSRDDVAYFSPREDLAGGAALSLRHQVCRRGEHAFAHRLTVSAGRYWQRGFDTGTTAAVHYEHLVDISDRLYAGYGVGRSRRVYDGEPDYASTANLEFSWRF